MTDKDTTFNFLEIEPAEGAGEKKKAPVKKADGIVCRICGYYNDKDAEYCRGCQKVLHKGRKLEFGEKKAVKKKLIQQKAYNVCKICGAFNEKAADYCKDCQAPLEGKEKI